MSEGLSGRLGSAVAQPSGLPRHAVWWQVLRPAAIVLAGGQPGLQLVGSYESLEAATQAVRPIPNGMVVMNVVVFNNAVAAAPPPPGEPKN